MKPTLILALTFFSVAVILNTAIKNVESRECESWSQNKFQHYASWQIAQCENYNIKLVNKE